MYVHPLTFSECTCPRPLKPWQELRHHKDCPVHGNVDERIDQLKEKRYERE